MLRANNKNIISSSNSIIAVGADHRGYSHKTRLISYIQNKYAGLSLQDVGTYTSDRTDYPQYVYKVCDLMQKGSANYGILLCGSGVGMSIAANRWPQIYAGLCWNASVARAARHDDKCNVLVIPTDYVKYRHMRAIVDAWLLTPFGYKRYQKRIDMIDKWQSIQIENNISG